MTKSIRYPCQGRRNNIMYNLKTVTTMLEHEIKNKVLTIGNRKGQTVYYAQPKSQQYFTNKMLIERIVRETSLSEGDVKNALVVVPSKMMDSAAEVTVKDALKTPKIVFTPKQKMRDAANQVELSIDKGSVKSSTGGGTTTNPDESETENPLG